MLSVLNSLIARSLWALLGPLRDWPPIAGLTVVSLIAAIALLAAFKWTSNQRALAETKRQILASLFELRLFQDDPRLMLRATGALMRQQARYLGHAFVPVLVASVPLALLLPQLHAYYGYDSLRPGDSTSVIVRLKPDAPSLTATPPDPHPCDSLVLDVPPGLHVDTPCVWAASLREGAWRISAEREGDFTVSVHPPAPSAQATVDTRATSASSIRVRVTEAIVPRSPVKADASWWNAWRYPAEPPLAPDAPYDAITVMHPARAIDIAGFELSWLIVFFVLTTIFMLIGRPILRVTL